MARRFDIRGGNTRRFIESPNYFCRSPYYYYDSAKNELVPAYDFKLSTVMPSLHVIEELIRLQENTDDELFIVCPQYKDADDIQFGGTESQKNSEETMQNCCIRGLIEEFQITAETTSAIESHEDKAYMAGRAIVYPYFLNISDNSFIHDEVKCLPKNESKFYGDKSFICVYGKFNDVGRIVKDFDSQNCMAKADNISRLVMISLSEITRIWDYHVANPASRDYSHKFKRTPRQYW